MESNDAINCLTWAKITALHLAKMPVMVAITVLALAPWAVQQ